MGNVLLGLTGMSWKVSKLKNNIYKMRGANIKNVYLINEKKLFRDELSNYQLVYVNTVRNLESYNLFRNELINVFGDDIKATIEILIPNNTYSAFNNSKILIL